MTTQRNIVFLAGIFPKRQQKFIRDNSIGVIQNAADAYQKNVIAGLAAQQDVAAVVVNLPFISAYPSSFKKAWYPAVTDHECGIVVEGRGFTNLSLIRYFARLLSALAGLGRGSAAAADAILVYSAHTPFMIAAVLAGRVFRRRRLAIIVLDLPEYMGAMGLAQTLFGGINRRLFYWLIGYFDRVVVLTQAMIPRLGLAQQDAIVVEGIAAANVGTMPPTEDADAPQSFLYTGTLALRYGIKELVDGFRMLDCSDAELWVCGAGEGAEYVAAAAVTDPRIRFYGQVDRARALEMQAKASFLVNPRGGEDDFVRYSFPSKVMEYLASGRPVIMYRLPGIPEGYDGYYLPISTPGANGIAAALSAALDLPATDRVAIGIAAQRFVRECKGPREQVQRIVELIYRD